MLLWDASWESWDGNLLSKAQGETRGLIWTATWAVDISQADGRDQTGQGTARQGSLWDSKQTKTRANVVGVHTCKVLYRPLTVLRLVAPSPLSTGLVPDDP